MILSVVEGDITEQDVDAVVNAANSRMRGGGGVDGAIHRAGGPMVLEDCRRRFPHGLETGQAGWTTGGDLLARWVIHVVGPNWNRGQKERSLLTACYANALHVADEIGARSARVPAGLRGRLRLAVRRRRRRRCRHAARHADRGRGGPDRRFRPANVRRDQRRPGLRGRPGPAQSTTTVARSG